MQLVSNWRDAWRFWSLRLVALGTTLVAIFTELPDVATNLWLVLPADLKSALPVEFGRYLGYAILALGLVARIVRQRKLVERKAVLDARIELDPSVTIR